MDRSAKQSAEPSSCAPDATAGHPGRAPASEMIDIGEVARRAGVPVSTLRYYEEKGLIESIGRVGLRRQFAPVVLQQLGLIALGRAAGFRLDEIATMITADGQPAIDRSRLLDRADEIEQTIGQLAALCDTLRHTAACPEENHLDCASFQRLLQAVSPVSS